MANLIRNPNQLISLLHLGVIDEFRIAGLGHAALLQFKVPFRRGGRQSPVGIVVRVIIGFDERSSVVDDGVQQDPVVIRQDAVGRGRFSMRQFTVLLEAKYVVHFSILMIALRYEALGTLALIGIRVAATLTVIGSKSQSRLSTVHLRSICMPVELVAVTTPQRDLLYNVAGISRRLLHRYILLLRVPLVRGLGGAVLVRQCLKQLGSVNLVPRVVRIPRNVVLQIMLNLIVRVLSGDQPFDHVLYQSFLNLLVALVGVDEALQDVDASLQVSDQAVRISPQLLVHAGAAVR